MSTNYVVVTEKYAERHFISKFRKKYKGAWDVTWKGVEEELRRIDTLLGSTNIAETICDREDIKICKTEFRVHGTKNSRRASGNRCIVAVHKNTLTVVVLLVYNKTDIGGDSNETNKWKELVRENYPSYTHFL